MTDKPQTAAGRKLYDWAQEPPIWDGKGEPPPLTDEQETWNWDLLHSILDVEAEAAREPITDHVAISQAMQRENAAYEQGRAEAAPDATLLREALERVVTAYRDPARRSGKRNDYELERSIWDASAALAKTDALPEAAPDAALREAWNAVEPYIELHSDLTEAHIAWDRWRDALSKTDELKHPLRGVGTPDYGPHPVDRIGFPDEPDSPVAEHDHDRHKCGDCQDLYIQGMLEERMWAGAQE